MLRLLHIELSALLQCNIQISHRALKETDFSPKTRIRNFIFFGKNFRSFDTTNLVQLCCKFHKYQFNHSQETMTSAYFIICNSKQ